MATKITNVQWTLNDGVPEIALDYDGHPATISITKKPALYERSLVMLFPTEQWAKRLKPIEISDPADHLAGTVYACVKDPRLIQLVDEAWDACASATFTPGPRP